MNGNRKLAKRSKYGERQSSAPPARETASTRKHPAFITLLTDFGLADAYVGVMKGVIANICAHATIIDLCHNVKPQDIHAAAFLLASSFAYFPPETVHVVVVDPTVGSGRRALCVQSGKYFFVGPDNGVLSVACYRAGRPKIFSLENSAHFLEKSSRTFHGRDVFAPVAGHLSNGVPMASFGPRIRAMERIRFPSPSRLRDHGLRGEVVYVDRFGNLITNIDDASMSWVFSLAQRHRLLITCGGSTLTGLHDTYSDVSPGMACALFGSYNLMEIAVREGNASSSLGVRQGEKVIVRLAE